MSFFIAEVSSNHQRDLNRCIEFIDVAAEIGCQAVKFQLFRINQLFAPEILVKSKKHRERQAWELPREFLPDIVARCEEKRIQFSCTPFYLDAVDVLRPHVDFFKIASYELLWDDLLVACAKTGKPIILSTGMATIREIEHAVSILKANGCHFPTLLHCTSAYPTPPSEANLSAIETIRNITDCDVGWSDHTVEPAVIHRAIHRWGAKVIEFHLDLDTRGDEYGAGHCWLPDQIASVIRDANKAMLTDGSGVKEPTPSEISDREWRADPRDGLRPLQSVRNGWKP